MSPHGHFVISLVFLNVLSYHLSDSSTLSVRRPRQIVFEDSSPTTNQVNRRGPACEGPGQQKGKCLPMDQCVLKELDQDYIKNKGYLCKIQAQGPVGVCCPDSIANPVVYREGMFGNKAVSFGRTEEAQE